LLLYYSISKLSNNLRLRA